MKDSLLIVDNDESILKCLDLMLRDEFDVVLASSGIEALEILKDRQVECIISDFDMEDGDGLFLLKNLTKKEVPFILITGRGDKDLFRTFANERAFYIFEKPVTTDISKVVRDAVMQYHKTQRQLKESLIGQSTGNIMHDLHNGLALIEGSANAGLSKSTKEASKYFSLAIRASKQISNMISKYKTIINGNARIQLSAIQANGFLREFVQDVKLSNGTRCSVIFESTLSNQDELLTDPDLLRQVLLNLVANSMYEVEHSPSPLIKIRAFQNEHFTVIEVEDSGSISDSVAGQLFTEGFSTKGEKGSGMGLCYCRDLLQKMNANIRLSKRAPTTFSITFSAR